jgi:nucleotide-binding universal stress UspA family protein
VIKHVLVPVTGEDGDYAVLATALLAARPFGAHLECLHVGVDISALVVSMSASGGGSGGVQDVVDDMAASNRQSETRAWKSFLGFCADAGISAGGAAPGTAVTADLVMESGAETELVPEYGRFADLVVLGRRRQGQESAQDVMEAALMDSGRPLLVAPEHAPTALLGTVVIAWEDSPEAARAVFAAMPLLERAERIVILSVSGDAAHEDATAERLARSLRWHHGAVSVAHIVREGRAAADVLLDEAKSRGATLMVMGGYSRSRLREAVFGGVTQRMLEGADLPVLLAH